MHTASVLKPGTRVRKGPFAELLTELNRHESPHAWAEHDGTIAFGPSMRVERFVLGNGLRVLVLEDHVAPVICLQTWFGVGSRHEREGKTGIAHLFEHLMFGETETTPHGAFDRMLEEAGAETNAATYLDWTFYHTNLPAEALELTLRLEANRMSQLVLREPQVTSEKDVVANERRQRVDDDVDGSISEALYKEAFREHGYKHPTIGWMDDILGFTTDDCVEFYKTYYSPNNATMVVVGDVDIGQVLRLVQETYGHMPPAEIPVEDVRPEPPQMEERRLSMTKPTPTHKLAIGYKSPALGDFDHAPLVLLNEILFGGRSSRAHRELVQKQEIASEVRAYVGSFRDPGLYDVFLSAREGHTAAELLTAIDEILDRVKAEPVSEAELAKAKGRVEFALLQGLETVSGKAEQIGFYQTVLGDPGAIFDRIAVYRRVTSSDLLRVARRYLVRTARTVIEVFPDGTSDEEMADGVDDGEEEEVAS
ncbi:MAG: insulinase family protein [Polyangiaceae bacterium]|nr:insulinase family protein [Polyangiaceae bacterium]